MLMMLTLPEGAGWARISHHHHRHRLYLLQQQRQQQQRQRRRHMRLLQHLLLPRALRLTLRRPYPPTEVVLLKFGGLPKGLSAQLTVVQALLRLSRLYSVDLLLPQLQLGQFMPLMPRPSSLTHHSLLVWTISRRTTATLRHPP